MKVNDLVTVFTYTPWTCHENSVWQIKMISEPYAVIEMIKPWTIHDRIRWTGELAQVSLTELKLFEGTL